MLISRAAAGFKGAAKPLVTVTASGKYQLRVAFNAALMRGIKLSTSCMAIEWDETVNRLTFIADVGESYAGGWTYSLGYDGGGLRIARTMWLSPKRLPFLKPGKYEPVLGEVVGGEPGFEDMRHLAISITV